MTLDVSFSCSGVGNSLWIMFSIGKLSASGESSPGGSKVDEVASAVAAVSDEIGDILKDELGDADRADRIGAELADLSAELGLLAGLADEPSQDFPSLFEIAVRTKTEFTRISYLIEKALHSPKVQISLSITFMCH